MKKESKIGNLGVPFMYVPRGGDYSRVAPTTLDQRRPIEGFEGQYIRFKGGKTPVRLDPDANRPWDVVSTNGTPLKPHEVPFHEQPKKRLAKSPRNVAR